MGALVDEVRELHDEVLAGGGAQYVERHRSRGKMLVRERLEALVDPGTPVLELCPLAGLDTGDPVGGGVVVALAEIAHTQCLVIANDPTVRGGTTSPTTIRKLLRAMDVAEENRLPLLLLVESGGADLPRQADVFVPGGEQFRRLTQLSAQGIPTVCVVFGSSTAGGAYLPGMSDYTVMVEGRARVFLGGPPLVKMAIGEEADEEELGGARDARRDLGAVRLPGPGRARRHPHRTRHRGPPALAPSRSRSRRSRRRAALPGRGAARHRLGGRAGALRRARDPRPRRGRLPLRGVQGAYGAQLVCGWASIGGYPIGVVANNGILFSPEAQKGAQFIALCNRSDTPILFVQNITGFMVGTRYEQGGIIKDGAKLINAVSNSTVPHLTLMVGASYGAGNYAMAGRAYDPRFVFTWPNHRIAVMGPKQLAGVLSIVRRNAAEAAGPPLRRGGRRGAAPGHRAADRRGVDRAVRHRAAVGRRHHRSAGHAHGARHRADRGALRPGARAPPSSAWCGTDGRAAACLVANRGEIARRIIRGVHDAGFEAVAVYAAEDAAAPTSERPTPPCSCRARRWPRPTSTPAALVGAAGRRAPTPCIPGYGFLSENPDLPEACAAAGIVWVGPDARGHAGHGAQGAGQGAGGRGRRARAAQRGGGGRAGDAALEPPAAGVGYPLLVKASAGGGGRGMRLVRAADELAEAVAAAQREAAAAFGSDEVFLERYLGRPATSRSRSSGTATARCCISSTGSARCSGATRRWSRRRRPSSCPRRSAGDVGRRHRRGARGGLRGGRARWSSSSRRAGSTSWR